MRRYVAEAWNSYRERVIPADAPEVQVRESQWAFYAGAHALLCTLNEAVSEDPDPTSEDVEVLVAINAELIAFGKAVEDGSDAV